MAGSPYFSQMADNKVKFFVREWRKHRSLTQEQLAAEIGTSGSKVSKLETGEQMMNENWLSQLSKALRVSPSDLLRRPTDPAPETAPTSSDLIPAPVMFHKIPILGEVAAGTWLEVDQIASSEEPKSWLPFLPDPSLPLQHTYALIVRGTSLNRIAPEGSMLICVDLASGSEVQEGNLVIVERSRSGDLLEVTAKRVRRKPDCYELWPESNDPKWQQPIVLNGHDDHDEISVKIRSIVRKVIIEP